MQFLIWYQSDSMKFYNIISNNFKLLLFLVFLLFGAMNIQAQNVSNSPYSRFGVGDLQSVQTPRNVAMGGLSVALTGTQNLSEKNPASYMNLDSMSVTFELSLHGTFSKLSEKQPNSEILSARTNSASLGHISFAFPITSWLKSCFGLTPGSNMSYDVRSEYEDPILGKYVQDYDGRGGLNQVFLGFALGTNRVSVGANVNYHFGSFERQMILAFTDTVLPYPMQTRQEKWLEASGVSVDLGLQYKQPLSKNYQLGVGFSYTPKYKLNASRYTQVFSELAEDYQTQIIYLDSTEDGTLQMPDIYTFGVSIERLNRWVAGIEYSGANFKNYREFSQSDPNLSNAYTIRAGAELKGQPMETSFLSRLSYRVGGHYGTNHIIFQDAKVKQFGVSFGLGIPVRRSQSRIDLSVEFGRKGNMNDGHIQENYGRVVVGISAFDRWFIRGKFD